MPSCKKRSSFGSSKPGTNFGSQVARLDPPLAGDAVRDFLVDADAGSGREVVAELGRRPRAARFHVLATDQIEFSGCHARLERLAHPRQTPGRYPTRPAQRLQLFTAADRHLTPAGGRR